jgi:hypothetical protein
MRCVYTGDPLPFSALEIDHIVPLRISSEELARLKANGVIPADFDLNGLDNLLPTSRYTNGRKLDRVRGDNALVHFLDLARSSRPEVEKILRHDSASDRTLKGYLMLKAQAEQNDLDVDEVIDIKRQEVDGYTRLTEAPDVEEAGGAYLLNAALAQELMDKRLAIGGGDIHEVVLQNDQNEKTVCTTCAEFLSAKDNGLWPFSQFDMNCFGMADRACEMLRAITKTHYAPASAIRYPRIGCSNLDRWSAEWAYGLYMGDGAGQPDRLSQFSTVEDAARAGAIKVTTSSKTTFEVQANYAAIRVSELFRGDVDGDGEEEIVVFALFYATEGTLRAGSVQLAKPSREDGLIYPRDIKEAYAGAGPALFKA